MSRVTVFSNVLITLCVVFGLSFAARGEDSGQGKALYEQHCALCHGADGKGNGPAATSLTPHPTDFTRTQFWEGEGDKKIAEIIRNGHVPMPAFKMSTTEITAIIDYMKEAFKK